MEAKKIINQIKNLDLQKRYGKVYRSVGLLVESKGPEVNIGDVCFIHDTKHSRQIKAEVVGFQSEHVLLMPYEKTNQIGPGCLVESSNRSLTVKVGDSLIGRVLDGLGEPLNGEKLPHGLTFYETDRQPPNPLDRPPIHKTLSTGVKAIDSSMTVGRGQRIGIFAGSGVGKSTLLGMLARNSDADINVFALLGERGREVREFIEHELGEEGLKKSIVIAATSDQPALQRIKGAYTATAISEYFREKGYHVNLMMDSLTRIAMAQREIGLASGEPPTTKGYTPSVFAMLPQLLERTGNDHNGSITAFYTVLVDGDDMDEPIADAVRGLLDGHLVLDRSLAEKGQYPAINILKSVSRLMQKIISQEHLQANYWLRNMLSVYEENKELIQIGAYKKGSSASIDEAIYYHPRIMEYLYQSMDESISAEESIQQLIELVGDQS
ncbi:flagellar protein export ATPase FliI [Tenuibacillus multivorans]|uniref:Flagellum-specific ATP synthase n=1 Tax=Tenuibacillus multivorans TaxID=237069 RepID=A0A1G9XYS8_9BACI|nr:flagellar protein export ATPase FliI [Tenuibacillus multivorans]GEL75878.1 flagellum-specific ATP synthase [Tenuibacillus multivorans]SDN01992.1 flagellum-specific ATP synthase [Tenuibacillus multivorans]